MFKTALRFSALLLIAAVSFYCGRASKYAQSEPVATENTVANDNAKIVSLSQLPQTPASYRNIEYQLQKILPISDSSINSFLPEPIPAEQKISIPNNREIHYYPIWNEEDNPNNYDHKKIEKSHDAELLNKWCQTLCQQKSGQSSYDIQYPLAWNENGYTFHGEPLGQIQPVKEIFTILPGFPR